MKALLIAETREGKSLASSAELIAFCKVAGADSVMFMAGTTTDLPDFDGTLYLADSEKYGEYNPVVHKQLILDVVEKEKPDMIVFSHSSYGWDLAPRVAYSLGAAQFSEVAGFEDGAPVLPACNSKLRRKVQAKSELIVLTLQAGAFGLGEELDTKPTVVPVDTDSTGVIVFEGYEQAEEGGVDLGKAEVIVSAGRGIGGADNVGIVADLAKALGGEYGASRPVVDAEWVEHARQVGTTGQTVSPKLYVACGISGAIQHLAGMKKSEFVVAVNTDKDAPIGEVADVLVVADVKQFLPELTQKILGG
ncbi:electron transfer flavoprotein subunit alpha/FixB family protein [Desulfopila sp. IMCC35008]|uniref:electron transfer flavoprotein subunit alpha/FixB family protein n=1 Tax=Desulfopila sp. IMCC35008 TaxID=2653858 RepID=UPI0013D81542|nr:electron transfer flavoprotein subunit alpha/FixB family protein [Desulfopila sp. IMCC35008]